jgi:hypothetical protein
LKIKSLKAIGKNQAFYRASLSAIPYCMAEVPSTHKMKPKEKL